MEEQQSQQQIDVSVAEWEAAPEKVRTLVLQLVQLVNHQESLRATIESIAPIAQKRQRTHKQVVFVSDIAVGRQAKLAHGLREIGWEVILIHREDAIFDTSQIYSAVHRFRTAEEALVLASQYSPVVYHCFSSWNFEVSSFFLRTRPGKIVFDSYDVFAGSLQRELADQLQRSVGMEKFCLESADGLCCRGLQLQNAKRNCGYVLNSPKIFFPEYCWDKVEQYAKPQKAKLTDAIHAVYVGTINFEHFNNPSSSLNVYDREFIESLTSRGIHYHIYPYYGGVSAEQISKNYHDFFSYAQRNPLFHMHDPVPNQQLHEEISQYHFGLCCTSEQVDRRGDSTYNYSNNLLGVHNKPFDYLDAGIPVISYNWPVVERLLGRDGPCLISSREKCPELMASFDPAKVDEQFRDRISVARRRLSVWRQASRLARFYEEVARS